jgi:hypothetical protein
VKATVLCKVGGGAAQHAAWCNAPQPPTVPLGMMRGLPPDQWPEARVESTAALEARATSRAPPPALRPARRGGAAAAAAAWAGAKLVAMIMPRCWLLRGEGAAGSRYWQQTACGVLPHHHSITGRLHWLCARGGASDASSIAPGPTAMYEQLATHLLVAVNQAVGAAGFCGGKGWGAKGG